MNTGHERDQRIHELMLNDIFDKYLVGGIVFGCFGALIFLYGFGLSEYLVPVRVASLGVIAASILRFFIIKSSKTNIRNYRRKLRAVVWFNAVCFSAIFAMVYLELNFEGIHSTIAMAIFAFFLTGSVVNVAGDNWLFYPFLIITLTPILLLSFLRSGDDISGLIFSGVLLFIVAFIVGLSREYRRMLRKRFDNQIKLEESLHLLKEQTAQLVQTTKLAALGEMAGGMAHEINNPLAIIALITKRMQSNLEKEIPDHSQDGKFLKEIEETVVRISKIIKGLRNVSRGGETEETKEILLSDVFDDVMGICSEKFRSSHISLELIDPDGLVHTEIKCRRVQLSQVLLNLISNAFDAVGTLSEEKWVRISLRKDQKSLYIDVCNSGPVISESVKKKLFQPFFTTKEIGTGTGLGLSISRKIMEAHGGEIYLPENSKHTTFVIRLPVHAGASRTQT